MYSVLLVDDELIELETMEQYVPWEQAGIRVAGTARNGKEALGKLKELKPDIIVTDVRMPIMDGLEFGRRAKQIDKSVKIIYLSGHNEFQYIKSALQIEAAGYVLKPIDMEELMALLDKVKNKCEEEQLASADGGWLLEKLLLRIVREPAPDRRAEWIRQWENRAEGFASVQPYGAAYWTFEPPAFGGGTEGAAAGDMAARAAEALRRLLEKRLDASIVLETGMNTLFVIFQGKEQTFEAVYWELLRGELLSLLGMPADATVGLSGPYRGFPLLKEAFEESQRCNEEKWYRQAGAVIVPGMLGDAAAADPGAEQAAVQLVSAIQSHDEEQAEQLLADWFSGLRSKRIERRSALRGVIQLLTALEQHFASLLAGPERGHLLADHWRELSSLPTIAHYHAYALRFCKELLKASGEREQDRNQTVASQIARLLDERYHLPVTVEDIAKEVYLSPNYARTIFKEKTGETILDYLTRIRMIRAAELLKDRGLKVREIAHRVGYENVSYFCSVFQKHKGSTPNEYRKLHL
ncbi:response regulator [Paenibacillus soyae]|uniref:Response regulator n=1 Tax=Paenibacillus soyae TaxID=2969249 RepID=A0A9X2SC99_9BACL|nr:response regulator [Paenibacillus soyae]MCR2805792.1 response regulator [Paenibacillus soyae]